MADKTPLTPKSALLDHVMTHDGIERLRVIMAALRHPDHGCPWDRAQSFATIAPYTIEEAHEVGDAIARDDMDALCDELGDLLLQVIYHSQMASEADAFSLDDVILGICAKMIRRHPHVFGDGVSPGWEQIKSEERAHKGADDSAVAGVALGLPALLRAEKLQRRAARTGFDWPDADGPRAKVAEEIEEIAAASSHGEREEEFGDLLFSVVNWARHEGVDAEAALRNANLKFERRFRVMEEIAGKQAFASASLDEKEGYWQQAKRR